MNIFCFNGLQLISHDIINDDVPSVILKVFLNIHQSFALLLRFNLFSRMYSGGVSVTLYLHACQVRVTVGDSGLCCCTFVLRNSSVN